MSIFSRQGLQQRINDTLYANVNNEITPQAVNDLLRDMLDSGYVNGDVFPAFTTAVGRVGDTFRYQFNGDAVPSLFLVVQNVASKPTPIPAGQPQYLRLTQPGGGDYLSLKGNTEDTPVAGPLYLGSPNDASGAIHLFNNPSGEYYHLDVNDGLRCYLDKQGIFEISPSAAVWGAPLSVGDKDRYNELWDRGDDLYVARHKLEELLAPAPKRDAVNYNQFIENSENGVDQSNVGIVYFDAKSIRTVNFQAGRLQELPFRALKPENEELIRYPLRLVNTSSQNLTLGANESSYAPLKMTREQVILTPGGSWIEFVWCLDTPNSAKAWYMTDSRIYDSGSSDSSDSY
jgi:hypothetical protein